MWKSRLAVPAALTFVMALPASALASEIEHLKRENAEMKQMLMQMQKQLQDVMMRTDAMEQQAKKAAEDAGKKGTGTVKSKGEDITVSTTGGGIKVKSSKGNEFKIGAMLQFDHDNYDDFWGSSSAEENKIRRSRIVLSGKSGKNWAYKFTTNIDHEGSGDRVDTGFLKYSTGPAYVQVGRYKRPGMIEARTSANWLATIERSIVNELSSAVLAKPSFGGAGVGFGRKGDIPVSGFVGVFDNEIDESDGGDSYGLGARLSFAPKFEGGSFLHAGASFYTVDYKGNNYRMRSRMGLSNTGRPFETAQHKTDDVDQFGLELAYVNGPFSLQGEFMNVESEGTDNSACGASGTYTPAKAGEDGNAYLVDEEGSRLDMSEFTGRYSEGELGEDFQGDLNKKNTGDTYRGYTVENPGKEVFSNVPADTCDLEMDGFYLQAAYTLTGEARGYKSGSGSFTGIKPKDPGGAWEVVARYEDAEVEIPGRSLSADLDRMVLGVNWYVNRNVKLMLNYVDSEVDGCSKTPRTYTVAAGSPDGTEVPADRGPAYGIHKCNNDDGQALSFRGQYTF